MNDNFIESLTPQKLKDLDINKLNELPVKIREYNPKFSLINWRSHWC